MNQTPLKAIMSKPVKTVHVESPFSEVERLLREEHIRHLPIVNDRDQIVGLVTQRDLYRHLAPHISAKGPVYDEAQLNEFILKHAMTKDPQCLGPDDRVAQAVDLIVEHKYGCIPVVDTHKRVLGIVTEINILEFVKRRLLD